MSKTIVLYYSATGTTKRAAQAVANQLNADLAAIHPVKPYTAEDLNWHDETTRATVEQKQEHDGRVPIEDDLPDLGEYDNVIIGHPIWWGIPPRLIATTIDHLDLNCKVLATFGTSSSTGYDRAQTNVARTVRENGYQLDLQQGDVLNSPARLTAWVNSLNLK
ncbi:flavodoxin [Limosilactobacillus pontis]|uniref:flavodoxin n=1 Tax=Limosilactobacillus pontis TaxID=35787 RepID=UPI00224542B4|nr:flavodoxin [Limosilactobacillus pontis]MCX2187507.1 flavodoxin [Limosilactobacillus pontis]MCX2189246.1 flavodoxin [Limosilactobacillus pontis]